MNAHERNRAADRRSDGSRGPASTVLLAEDDATVARIVEAMLRKDGHAVLRAPDGLHALALAGAIAGPLHLLVTDVEMPRMEGPVLAAHVLRIHPGAAVVYMSGHADGAAAARVEFTPGAVFLAKPFTRRELTEAVQQALAARARLTTAAASRPD